MSAAATSRAALGPETVLSFAVLGVVAILVMPLPPAMLDALLAFSIGLSVLILLAAISVRRPLDFSVFPSLLLIVTLFRLGLNVSTTRLILLEGGTGPASVSRIVSAFGALAAGGDLVVGAVVFLVLIVINFVVITKGAGRVAEVSARFTLDALPGKQMSIDADLAAGLVDEGEARRRRRSLERESEFFGAMDGASKFVRGDAIAGLVITAINIVGGLAIGVLGHDQSFGEAASAYTILTMGDGLVSQIPALLVSTASGVVVTRAGGEVDLASEFGEQVFGQGKALGAAGVALAAIGLLPGMPLLPFAGLGGGAFLLTRRLRNRPETPAVEEPRHPEPERMEDLLHLDAVEVEVGYGLVTLIDVDRGGELPGRVTALRRQIATDLGVVLPPVHLHDALQLDPNEYRVLLRGMLVARGTAFGDRVMALDPAGGEPGIDGIAATEPAFGLPASWIEQSRRADAEARGLTTVDPASVLTTHLSEVLRRHAHEIVGRQEVQELLAVQAKKTPKLVEDVVPGTVSLGELVQVIRRLLEERVSVRDLRSILEAVADAAVRNKEVHYLGEQARRRLARQITDGVSDAEHRVRALTVARPTEELLRMSLGQQDGEPVLAPDVSLARRILEIIERHALEAAGQAPVLLVAPDLRRAAFNFLSRFLDEIHVITAGELVPGTTLDSVAVVDVAGERLAAGRPLGMGTAAAPVQRSEA